MFLVLVQKACVCGAKKNMSDREDGEEGDDEDDDTEDEILIVPTEITNEVSSKLFGQYLMFLAISCSFPEGAECSSQVFLNFDSCQYSAMVLLCE
jgi:hypothetical protein